MNEIATLTCLSHYVLFDDQDAFEQLRRQFRRMVYDIATKYTVDDGMEVEDLAQEGWIGFIVALRTYDPNRATRLITHLYAVVDGYIKNSLRKHDDVGKRSQKYWDVVKMGEAIGELYQIVHREPTVTEVAIHMGMSVRYVTELKRIDSASDPLSLDEPLEGRSESSVAVYDLHDMVGKGEDVELEVDLTLALDSLPLKLSDTVRLVYFEGKTYEEAGKDLGITKMGVKKRLERAITHLRTEMV